VAWRGRRSALPWIAAAAFALSFTAAYWAVLGPQSEVPRLRETWRDELTAEALGPPPVAAAAALWRYVAVSVPYLFPGLWPLAALLAAVGLFAWPRRHRGLLIALWLAPAAATVTAVLLGRYVTGHGRLLLFAAPPILLMVASGLVEAARAGGRLLGRAGGERLGVALAVVAGLGWSAQSVAHRVRPYRTDVSRYFLFDVLHDVDALVEKAERHVARGEPVMVSRYAGDAFLFYARGRLPGAVVCTRRTCPDEGPVLHAWLRGIRERGFLILLEEEERSGLRNTAGGEGLEVRTVAKARGVRLWELTRARPGP
jgi:hypothetical protein